MLAAICRLIDATPLTSDREFEALPKVRTENWLDPGRGNSGCVATVAHIVGFQIERIAIEAAVPYLPESRPVLPEALSAALHALPARPSVPQVILKEKQVVTTWLIGRLKGAEQQNEGAWQGVWNEFGKSNEDMARYASGNAPVKTLYQAVTTVEGMIPFFDQLAKMAALPWKEFDPEDGQFYVKTRAASPLAATFLHPMVSLVGFERRNETQMALFKAAIAVVQDGPDKVKNIIKDPASNEPFEFRVTDKGFELKSKLIFNSKPVMLRVGEGKKN
jgi:hypothetical protein